MVPVFIILISLTTSNAAAADISGTWTSNVAGKGYTQNCNIFNGNYDIKLVLTQSGNTVSGTIYTTCTYAKVHAGYEDWGPIPVGQKNTNSVTGTVTGSNLALTCYTPAQSGTTNGISWTTEASTITWNLQVEGNQMTGSGTYTAAGIPYTYAFDLVSGEGSGLSLIGADVSAPAIFAVAGGAVCLVASFVPLPRGRIGQVPPSTGGSPYPQQSDVGTTGGNSGAPTEGQSMGGIGLHTPADYVNGVPVKPKQWQSQNQGPTCPVHGTMCRAAYKGADDLGEWYCPKCREQGLGSPPSSGFPWGPR
jgi:hypothetical protein